MGYYNEARGLDTFVDYRHTGEGPSPEPGYWDTGANKASSLDSSALSLYNGNIRCMASALDLRGQDTRMGYAYRYDMLNRLVSVDPYRLEGQYWQHVVGRSKLDTNNMVHSWQSRCHYGGDARMKAGAMNGPSLQPRWRAI